MLDQLTTAIETTKTALVTHLSDLSRLEELKTNAAAKVDEARASGVSMDKLLTLRGKLSEVETLLTEQSELVEVTQKELKKLEVSHKVQTLLQQARTQVQVVTTIKAETTTLLQDLEVALQPFAEKITQHWQQWQTERSKYFEAFEELKRLGVFSAKDLDDAMRELEQRLKNEGMEARVMRLNAFFGSGHNAYNEQFYPADLFPLTHSLISQWVAEHFPKLQHNPYALLGGANV